MMHQTIARDKGGLMNNVLHQRTCTFSQQQPQDLQAQQQPQTTYLGMHPDDIELNVYETTSSALSSGAPSPIWTPLSDYGSPTLSVTT